MASNLLAMASNLLAMVSNLLAMASNLLAIAFNALAMASNLRAKKMSKIAALSLASACRHQAQSSRPAASGIQIDRTFTRINTSPCLQCEQASLTNAHSHSRVFWQAQLEGFQIHNIAFMIWRIHKSRSLSAQRAHPNTRHTS